MDGDDAREAQNRLTQPAHTEEQQQDADDNVKALADLLMKNDQRSAKDTHDHRERAQAGQRAPDGRTPAADVANGQDDSERFDPLDHTGDEGRHRGDSENCDRVHSYFSFGVTLDRLIHLYTAPE